MVVDNKLFTPKQMTLPKGLFWVLEQIPNFIHKEDLTSVLAKKTFWPSYNSPYFKGKKKSKDLYCFITLYPRCV